MRYGYVRVSTKDQNIARQMSALTGSGIEKKYIYCGASRTGEYSSAAAGRDQRSKNAWRYSWQTKKANTSKF